jgi:DNA polymerase-1
MKKKIMLIDGNSILNRAFYGLSGRYALSTKDGIPTNAVFGFLNIIDKYIEEEKPEYISVAFDLKHKTFRHDEYKEYKANRRGMPDELAIQLPIVKELLDALNIKRFEVKGYEADDVLGTLAKQTEKEGLEAIIVTGDRDSLQLVSDGIRVKYPSTRGGKTSTIDYTKEAVVEKYGLEPEKLIEVKGLMGDSSDNIPGVKGVGEKTALKLVSDYSSLEGVYENIDNISGKSLKEKLINDREMAFISRKLGTIKTDIENLYSDISEMEKDDFDKEKLLDLFRKLEFKSFIKKYGLQDMTEDTEKGDEKKEEPEINIKNIIIKDNESLQKSINEIKSNDNIYIDFFLVKRNNFEKSLEYLAILSDDTVYHYDMSLLKNELLLNAFKDIFSSESIKKTGFDIKPLMLHLKNNNIDFDGLVMDIAIGDYVINANDKHEAGNIIYRYLDMEVDSSEDILGKGRKAISFFMVTPETKNSFFSKRLVSFKRLKDIMEKEIEKNGLHKVFYDIEMPLIKVLVEMEYNGFMINVYELKEYSDKLKMGILELRNEIYEIAGEEFNINSPKQLGVILFDKLALPVIRKTKTGYSTDIEVLEQLYFKHEIIEKIIKYRQLTKLESTYAEGLMKVISPKTGKIHTSFSQITAVTGRLSSIEPNLQNIPVKLEMGRELRKMFIAENDDFILTGADYSQIELRILAAITKDENLLDAFNNNEDIHTTTAMKVFDLPKEMITTELRIKAKAVNFSIIYGIGAFSLSKDINVPIKEAERIINEYLKKYPGIAKYMEEIVDMAREKGYVKTVFGRRRDIPELKSKNHNIREFGKRAAMNTPVQGSAADVIKIAMIKVYDELKKKKMKSRLLLQVHDELIIETHKSEIDEIKELLIKNMENAVELGIKMKIDINTGKNWYETK